MFVCRKIVIYYILFVQDKQCLYKSHRWKCLSDVYKIITPEVIYFLYAPYVYTDCFTYVISTCCGTCVHASTYY